MVKTVSGLSILSFSIQEVWCSGTLKSLSNAIRRQTDVFPVSDPHYLGTLESTFSSNILRLLEGAWLVLVFISGQTFYTHSIFHRGCSGPVLRGKHVSKTIRRAVPHQLPLWARLWQLCRPGKGKGTKGADEKLVHRGIWLDGLCCHRFNEVLSTRSTYELQSSSEGSV